MKKILNNLIKTSHKMISPFSQDEYRAQREKTLNILLWLSVFVFIIINLVRLIHVVTQSADRGLPIVYTLLILACFMFLLYLSRHGYFKISAWILILTYTAPMLYSFIRWGADLPAVIILGALVITPMGVLIGSRAIFWGTATLSLFLIYLTYLQNNDQLPVANYWRSERHEIADAVVYALLLMMIATIAHLFCSTLEKALGRAHQSEHELRQERNSLEKKVASRSQELQQANREKIENLYRLAEFGRLSSGIFHDLINPLTAVSLNLEQIKETSNNRLTKSKSYLHQATLAAKKMEGLLISIKKQVQAENVVKSFSINTEVEEVIEMIAYKARQAKVKIVLQSEKNKKMHGCPMKFNQIIMNLLSNAIEASQESKQIDNNEEKEKIVTIDVRSQNQEIIITVKDYGVGIAPENMSKIFTPFFSTKPSYKNNSLNSGLGLGLSSVKNIIEKDFQGNIKINSQPGLGAEFIIHLPQKNIILKERSYFWPQWFQKSTLDTIKIKPKDIKALCRANFYLWRALNIYDNFLDEVGQTSKLPMANSYYRYFLKTCYQLNLNLQFKKLREQILTDLDATTLGEIKRNRHLANDSCDWFEDLLSGHYTPTNLPILQAAHK